MGKHKLSVKRLTLSLGIVSGGSMALIALGGMAGYWIEMVELIQSFYPGYGAHWQGFLLGAIYGFIDGAIGGALIAWLYNKMPS